mmetsp:Transcript_40450/g.61707  ORF Transcript_40450/g.61707 Transcript_40450/m.61707 type:complete len:109 (-) Transcript_40450:1166-1492(-)
MNRLPYSFRFYDPIINMVTKEFNGGKRDFIKLRNSVQMAFNLTMDEHKVSPSAIAAAKAAEAAAGAFKSKKSGEFKEKRFDFKNSSSTRQVQKSRYLKIDDDISRHAF